MLQVLRKSSLVTLFSSCYRFLRLQISASSSRWKIAFQATKLPVRTVRSDSPSHVSGSTQFCLGWVSGEDFCTFIAMVTLDETLALLFVSPCWFFFDSFTCFVEPEGLGVFFFFFPFCVFTCVYAYFLSCLFLSFQN